MRLFTIIYAKPVEISGINMTLSTPIRVWADDSDSAYNKCERELGSVYMIIVGHPEIVGFSGDDIATYDWGN